MKVNLLKFLIILILLFFSSSLAQRNKTKKFDYLNPELTTEQRANDLLSHMTLEEKFWQLFMIPGGLSKDKEK